MDQAPHDIFDITRTFGDLGIEPRILAGITARGFKHPTHIQSLMIPPALAGKDCLGQAKTGSGKTVAFALPILHRIKPGDAFGALILVPTRELAIQVSKELRDLAEHAGLHALPVYGGQPIRAQASKLERRPEVVVGTPGRVMDMHDRGLLPYDKTRIAVLDEVDRMLDIGFRDDIRKILGGMKHGPQTIFVSATISPEIEKLARAYMRNPEKIVAVAKSLTVSQVKQSYISVEHWDKRKLLLHLLKHESPALTLVFCRTKRTVDLLQLFLTKNGIDAHAMHGDMYQTKRDKVMSRLRDGDLKVLVASDLAARGLDVEDISHVINYDLPEDPEVYVHRIGRTARAGRDGIAWAFVCPDQGALLQNIEMLTNVEISRLDYPAFEAGRVPDDVRAHREIEAKRREDSLDSKSRDPTVAPVDATDTLRFPGGLVPIAPPHRRLGGRMQSRRR
ncbi:MAG: DEAD/DEAH box helicase [Phycisphaerales bacterium]|nr:DEAD/DEAH box helicase [Phycisphaerales bacterium]